MSDTYHSHEFIVRLITANGYPVRPESVYVSSDRRMNKQSGKLFRHVFPMLGVAVERIFHIGDHPVSDFQVPKQLGAAAMLHPFRPCADRPAANAESKSARLDSYIHSVCAFESKCGKRIDQFWWLLSHNIFGPLITGFCLWLDRLFRADKVARAYFLHAYWKQGLLNQLNEKSALLRTVLWLKEE